jgi:proteic killer suppression protein
MNVTFADKDIDRLETDPKFAMGLAQPIVKAFRRRMQQIRAALDERDFYANKGMHYEQLKGPRLGQRSIRLNDQMRLIITIQGGGADATIIVVSIEDYH